VLFPLSTGGFWDYCVCVGTGLIFIIYEPEPAVALDSMAFVYGLRTPEVPPLFYFIL